VGIKSGLKVPIPAVCLLGAAKERRLAHSLIV
jgi:hypothetical protein